MNKEDIWNLFKKTGDISYYLDYIKLKEGNDFIGRDKDRGNNSK